MMKKRKRIIIGYEINQKKKIKAHRNHLAIHLEIIKLTVKQQNNYVRF